MKELQALHVEEFGHEPDCIARAPGVINLMGEHTDYSEGFVLQAALPLYANVAVSRRDDLSLRFYTADAGERKKTSVPNLKYKREDRWANYIKGVLSELADRGIELPGLEFTITSTIPQNIGLGSSDALCTAAAIAVCRCLNVDLPVQDLIDVAWGAEARFIGLAKEPSTVATSLLAVRDKAVFLDMRSMEYRQIPLDLGPAVLVLTNSHVPHISVQDYIEERREECRQCVEHLQARHAGNFLRDYSVDDLKGGIGILPETLRRLCMHVVEENQRVKESVQLLPDGDLEGFGRLMYRSHESLRDAYEVSCPELDWLVKRSGEIDGVYGSRLTGPGFGGCTITLIRESSLNDYIDRLSEYERIFGFAAEAFQFRASDGAKAINYENSTDQ
jgi:galactokinase